MKAKMLHSFIDENTGTIYTEGQVVKVQTINGYTVTGRISYTEVTFMKLDTSTQYNKQEKTIYYMDVTSIKKVRQSGGKKK